MRYVLLILVVAVTATCFDDVMARHPDVGVHSPSRMHALRVEYDTGWYDTAVSE